jgi:regulator of replication initiation timing
MSTVQELELTILKLANRVGDLERKLDAAESNITNLKISNTSLITSNNNSDAKNSSTSKGKNKNKEKTQAKNIYQFYQHQLKNCPVDTEEWLNSLGAIADKKAFHTIINDKDLKIPAKTTTSWKLVSEESKKDGGPIRTMVADMFNKTLDAEALLSNYLKDNKPTSKASSTATSPKKETKKSKKKAKDSDDEDSEDSDFN